MKAKHLLIAIVLMAGLSSCKKAIPIHIDIYLHAPLDISEGADMPKDIKEILNYEILGKDSFVFPMLKFIRLDFKPAKEQTLTIEHTAENKIRTAGNIIKGDNYQILKADWDEALPKLKAPNIIYEKSPTGSGEIPDRKYDATFFSGAESTSEENEFTDIKKLREYIFEKYKTEGKTEFALLYNSDQSPPPPPTVPPGGPFAQQMHDKLMQIVECKKGETKIYEERFKLASEFSTQYIDANTEIKQFTAEGFFIRSHIGKEAERYVRALAEDKICLSDLQVAEITQSASGKIGLIKIKEKP